MDFSKRGFFKNKLVAHYAATTKYFLSIVENMQSSLFNFEKNPSIVSFLTFHIKCGIIRF